MTLSLFEKTIRRLQDFEPSEGYYLADSGGKDSSVLLYLAKQSGVKFDAHYQFTSVDPPPLVKFIKQCHPETEIHKPEMTMFQLIMKKGLPTRQFRFCCEVLKERGGGGRFVLTGIRWEESHQRKTRRMFEYCQKDRTKKFLHPLCDWTWQNIWTFIHKEQISYCELYNSPYNFKRIGCIGCPYAYPNEIRRQFQFFPKFRKAYLNTIAKRKALGKWKDYPSVEDVLEWWISNKSKAQYLAEQDQLCLFA